MITSITTMTESQARALAAPLADAGIAAIRTDRGNLPLRRIDLVADLVGLTSAIRLTQEFVNHHPEPLEATYVFPLPDRAAVTGLRLAVGGRVIEATLAERSAAREQYDQAIVAGRRAAIAEEERPDVFTLRVGNILPGERVTATLTLTGTLPIVDGQATFRFPLVVAPRYIPGEPLGGESVGQGYAEDTEAVPDASRITPPVLLPGFPNPVDLSIEVGVDPAGLVLAGATSSLHPVSTQDGRFRVAPGERVDRDFILRLDYRQPDDRLDRPAASLRVVADDRAAPAAAGEGRGEPGAEAGTFELTVLPPAGDGPPAPRDVVLLLDRSGSMAGWKMVAARRAAARIIDTLLDRDRFAVLAFDTVIETPALLPSGLVAATDRHRYRGVEQLARTEARGGTELLQPIRTALSLLRDGAPVADRAIPDRLPEHPDRGLEHPDHRVARQRVIVLITDGQVGDEDRILREVAAGPAGVRIHSVGIDQAVNAGFLGRLASAGRGRCELVESEDRLDQAMDLIHRRVAAPLIRGIELSSAGFPLVAGSHTPARLPDLFPGVPYLVRGRYRGTPTGSLTLTGTTRQGDPWSISLTPARSESPALAAGWARGHLRDLEDQYLALGPVFGDPAGQARATQLEQRIVETSLAFGVLCRFTAFVAVDTSQATDGGHPRQLVQPVELPAGWPQPAPAGPPFTLLAAAAPAPMAAVPPQCPGAPPAGAPRSGFGTSSRRRRPSPAAAPALQGAPADPGRALADLAERAAAEALALRAAETEPDQVRRELLEDLGTRLVALARAVQPANQARAVQPSSQALSALLELLTLDVIARTGVAELWREVLRLLDELAEGRSRAAGPATAPRRTRPFWKL